MDYGFAIKLIRDPYVNNLISITSWQAHPESFSNFVDLNIYSDQ